MRKSKFTREQIIETLTEEERGMAAADVCQRHGVRIRRAPPCGRRGPDDDRLLRTGLET